MDRLAAEVGTVRRLPSAAGRDEYDGQFTRRTGSLIERCPASRELVMHPTVVDTVRHFLGHATASATTPHATDLGRPGETKQKPHRDQMAFDFFEFPVDYHVQCNTMWALTDFTVDNGATHIHPGTSAQDDDAAQRVPSEQATMRRGQRVVLRRQGAPRRRSERQRRGTPGCQHHLCSRLGASGREPVPGLLPGSRTNARRRPVENDGLSAGSFRARLRRRSARCALQAARRPPPKCSSSETSLRRTTTSRKFVDELGNERKRRSPPRMTLGSSRGLLAAFTHPRRCSMPTVGVLRHSKHHGSSEATGTRNATEAEYPDEPVPDRVEGGRRGDHVLAAEHIAHDPRRRRPDCRRRTAKLPPPTATP